jgi:D-amino-acid oxidase
MSPERDDVVVVGAGVIGLTTAACLAEAGVPVRIVTAAMPQQTTSRAAAAMWGGSFLQPAGPVRRWAEVAREDFTRLAGQDGTGVHLARGTLMSCDAERGPPPYLFPEVEIRALEHVRDKYLAGFTIVVPLVDMPRYLDYLLERFQAAGGELELRTLERLDDLAGEVPVVVNCAGIGARDLVPDPDLHPVRGQHVVVENPGLREFFMDEPLGERWVSFFPHGDHVVLGSVAQPDQWSLEPDAEIAEQIVRQCVEIEPRLRGARVIEHRVGLRPARAQVRLEEEPLGPSRCVHNYGHSGSGVALSWGCAREVVGLLTASM